MTAQDTTQPASARRALTSDALAAMADLGAPTLIIGSWAGALALVTASLAELVTDPLPPTAAWGVALAVATVFVLLSWVRVVAPQLRRGAAGVATTVIALAWLGAGLDGAGGDSTGMAVAVLAPAWATVGTWAAARLVVNRQGRTEHALYRFFDSYGRLLYVGRTSQPPARRFGQHASDKWWYQQVATRTVTYLPTLSALIDAEAEAIRRENPRHNKIRYRGVA